MEGSHAPYKGVFAARRGLDATRGPRQGALGVQEADRAAVTARAQSGHMTKPMGALLAVRAAPTTR